MLQTFMQGFLLQGSLILALGAQNLFVIDVGLKRNHHLLAATICALCDLALIFLGVLGVSALIVKSPIFKLIMGILGALFLLYYSVVKFREFLHSCGYTQTKETQLLSAKLIVLATLSFTLLNPHVYIDTIFLIGGYSTRFEELNDKLIFGLGAGSFSTLWFFFLALFSARFSNLLTKEKNLKIISLTTSLILAYLAIRLGQDSYHEYLSL